MSHLRKALLSIRNPNLGLLKTTLDILTRQYTDVEFVDTIRDYYGNKTDVVIGFKCKEHKYGVGIQIKDDGTVQIIGDDYMQKLSIDQFKKLLNQNYTQMAVGSALNEMGYNTQARETDEGIFVMGVQ